MQPRWEAAVTSFMYGHSMLHHMEYCEGKLMHLIFPYTYLPVHTRGLLFWERSGRFQCHPRFPVDPLIVR